MIETIIVIDEASANQRLDRFLRKFFKDDKDIKLWDIYAGIRKWDIKINKHKTKEEYRLNVWDSLLIKKLENKVPRAKKEDKLDMEWFKTIILYEDENWLVVNKPFGMVMHTTNPWDIAIQDYLDIYCKDLKNQTFKASFWYRLDKDTTGVLIAAKTFPALQFINKIIREREVSKYYIAIVVGRFPEHVIIDKALEKSFNEKFGRGETVINERYWDKAVSECWLEQVVEHEVLWEISLIKVKIQTGRMHQIRVHTASIWYPVLWDIVYGKAVVNRILFKKLNIKRQLLHAQEYSFFDIFKQKKIKIDAQMPGDFKEVLNNK